MASALFAALGVSSQTYTIRGEAPELEGQTIYIGEQRGRNDFVKMDSALVTQGRFVISNPLEAVRRITVLMGRSSKTILLTENPLYISYRLTETEVKGKQIRLPEIVVRGDKDQELLDCMNNALKQEMYSMLAISFMGKDKDVNAPENKALADSIAYIFTTAKNHTKQVLDSLVIHFPDSYVSGIVLNDFWAKERSVDTLQQAYEMLSHRVKASSVGATLRQTIEELRSVKEGAMAPDFELSTPDGTSLRLSSLRGKCVLLDFWASWCGPCLREAPHLRALYGQYKDRELEILSVSLDHKEGPWKEAIAKHGLNWLHVSSLQAWKCPVARLYRVSAVPTLILIDSEGRIAAVNVHGEALEQAVSKCCNHQSH